MTKDEPNSIELGWRRKYSDTVYELERQQHAWVRTETLLRRFISKLSLSIRATDPRLIEQLELLRDAIGTGVDATGLSSSIERISALLSEVEKKRSQAANDPANQTLLSLLESMDIPGNLKVRADKLRNHLLNARSEEFPRLLKETQVLLQQAIQSPAPTSQEGFWSRLFSTADNESEATPTVAVLEGPREILRYLLQRMAGLCTPKQLLGWERSLGQAQSQSEYTAIVDGIIQALTGQRERTHDEFKIAGEVLRSILTELMETIVLPNNLRPEADSLKEQIQASAEAHQTEAFVNGVQGVAQLVRRACQQLMHERQELEDFLQQLNTRLSTLDADLKFSVELRLASIKDGTELGVSVQDELTALGRSAEQSNDLATLKSTVQHHVKTIEDTMTSFREKEDERNLQSLRLIKHLAHEVYKLEKEGDRLRQQIEQAENRSLLDSLTGVPNRKAYEGRIAEEISRAQRYNTALVLSIWDVDHFKHINDHYGHAAGDRALKVIADRLNQSLRESDFLARYGGEEFVIIMPGSDIAGAMQAAEKLRRLVESSAFHFREVSVPITISAGLAQCLPGDAPHNLFERADQALYRAKEMGRNRCVSA